MQEKKSVEASLPQPTNQQIIEAAKSNPQNGVAAHEAAEADMQSDTDLNNEANPDDGLDEGELARLEGED